MSGNPNWPTGIYGGKNYGGCSCGHVLQMCHKRSAAQWCGGDEPVEDYRAALIRCAELAGADLSGGIPSWPSLQVFAIRAVEQLRADYDEALTSANVERSSLDFATKNESESKDRL